MTKDSLEEEPIAYRDSKVDIYIATTLEEAHYRFCESLLNDFKNKKISYTEFIDKDLGFISLALKRTRQATIGEYSQFLEKNGYLDTDWREEKPTAIERYLKK